MESPSMFVPTANVARPPLSLPFVHRYYILLKAHYFLYFSSFGMIYPIINITLRGRGLSNTELSYINIIIPFLIFFTNPLLGFIADHSRRYLSTFNVIFAISAIAFSIMFVLPTVKTRDIRADLTRDHKLGHVLEFCASQEVATKCASRSLCGCLYQANCTSIDSSNHKTHSFFTFSMNSSNVYEKNEGIKDISEPATCGIQYRVPIDQTIKEYTKNRRLYPFHDTHDSSRLAVCEISCSIPDFCRGPRFANQLQIILLYSLLFIIASNLLSNAIPLGASIGFATLTRPDLFGQQRIFGTVGFGISAFVASRIYGIFRTEYVYIIMFCITTIICIINTSFIHIEPKKKLRSTTNDEIVIQEKEINDSSVEKKKKKSQSQLSALLPLLKDIDVLVFLSLTFIWGMSYAGLDPYLYLYIDEIAECQSHSIIGWMSLVASIAEILGFFLAARIIKTFGINLTAVIVLLAFALRFAGYYFIIEPYLLIPVESMHFFNFGVFYVLIAQKADAIAPSGLSGTLQGVALGLSFGLGRGVGLLIASFIYTLIEPRSLFLIIAIFNLVAALVYSLYFILHRQFSKKSVEKNANIPNEYDGELKQEPLLDMSTKNQNNEE